jgi:hypothetical protein
MKYIVAGYSKTGTKSVAAALIRLGLKVHDLAEHLDEDNEYWWRILKADPKDQEAQTPAIFKKMYENVDACTDTPSYMFWEQIMEVFPDAKVILVERDEDKWAASLEKHMLRERKENHAAWLVQWFPWLVSFIHWRVWMGQVRHRDLFWNMAVGPMSPDGPNRVNMMIARKRYREHNAYVKLRCPAEKLLEFKIADGWAPLCDFMNVAEPEEEFPHANKGGQIVTDILKQHRLAVIDTKLFALKGIPVLLCIIGFVGFLVYSVYLAWFASLF